MGQATVENWSADDTAPERVSAARAALQRHIPAYYTPYIYFPLTNLVGIAAMVGLSRLVHDVRPLEWLTIPAAFLFANFMEYNFHRGPMHRKWSFDEMVFDRHTRQHHRFFTHSAMGFDAPKDCYMVFFPYWAIFLMFGVTAPVFFILWALLGLNIAALYQITAVGYYLMYEWLHWSYHVPESHWIGRNPLIRALRRHHQAHHNPHLMTRWNFNITFPIMDVVFRTAYKEGND